MQYYDEEERKLIEEIESSDWVSIPGAVAHYKKFFVAHFKRSERINIRISENDLQNIKKRAALEGMPYQTLISSIIHKYGAGVLKEEK